MVGENMEPMLSELDAGLGDQILELAQKSSSYSGSLNPALKTSVGNLIRAVDSHFSNAIEGHVVPLVDIVRALEDDHSFEPGLSDLQIEARAHVEVQQMIDRGALPFPAASVEGIRWIHREFSRRLPKSAREFEFPATKSLVRMEPGELRTLHVKVGRHVAPEPAVAPMLLARFEEAYASPMLSKTQRILAVAASHHRLTWIHPFIDGNGRVARLLSHAMLRELGVGSELWSVSRGLFHNVGRYRSLLQAADQPRRGDLDGRGALTETGLAEFCRFFLGACIEQVDFMRSLLEPAAFMNRVELWTEQEVHAKRLPKGSWRLLREAILAGEYPRSRATDLTGYQDRQARTVISQLIARGCLVSSTPKGAIRLGFPAAIIERWLPGLCQLATGENPLQR
ncbi:Fic family protein [Bradyrhizobium sp. USDA 4341]